MRICSLYQLGLVAGLVFTTLLAGSPRTWAVENLVKVPIGSDVKPFALTDYQGKKWSSQEFAKSQAVVLVFLGTQCPLAKLYADRINKLEVDYKSSGITFLAVNPNVHDSSEMMAAFARKHKLEIPFLKDLSELIGDIWEDSINISTGRGGRSQSRSLDSQRRPLATISQLAALPLGRAWVFASGATPVLIQTQPWMTSPNAPDITQSIKQHAN